MDRSVLRQWCRRSQDTMLGLSGGTTRPPRSQTTGVSVVLIYFATCVHGGLRMESLRHSICRVRRLPSAV